MRKAKRQTAKLGVKMLSMLGLKPESPEERAKPSCVMLQIDGLSHFVFQRALKERKLPFLAALIRKGKAVNGPWQSMLPTSTSAFQAGLFYGNNDDIPGFFWFDKKLGREIKMNSMEDTARMELEIKNRVAPYPGLLAGGSSYSALFTGGAANSLMTFAKMLSPKLNLTLRRGWLILFLVFNVMLIARILYYSMIEVVLAIYDLVKGLFSEKNKFLEFKFLIPRIGSVVLIREIATLAAILDIYRGVGPIYLNHLAYDEHAHHRGPDSKFALWTLRGLDASIKRVWEAAEMARELGIRSYDVFVWSDHGQCRSVPFQEIFEQTPERHFDLIFRALYGHTSDQRQQADSLRRKERIRRGRILRGQIRRHAPHLHERQTQRLEYLEEIFPSPLRRVVNLLIKPAKEAEKRDEKIWAEDPERRIRVVSTGPVAHLCLMDDVEPLTWEDWQERFPEYLKLIAAHQGVGFALARRRDGGCMVGCTGHWFNLKDEAAIDLHASPLLVGILRQRKADLCRWAVMPSAGDIILFGLWDSDFDIITYSYERGSHTGPSRHETTAFILIPSRISGDWPEVTCKRNCARLTLQELHQRLREHYPVEPANNGKDAPACEVTMPEELSLPGE